MGLVAYIPTVLVGGIAVVMHFLHPERKRATLPRTEEVMTTLECITVFFSQVATHRQTIPNHPHATFVEPRVQRISQAGRRPVRG